MKNLLLSLCFLSFCAFQVQAQSVKERIEADIAAKETAIADLQAALADAQAQLASLPDRGWDLGLAGLVGVSHSSYNNWVIGSAPKTTSINLNADLKANYFSPDWFWNNTGYIKLGYQDIDGVTVNTDGDAGFQRTIDEIYIASLGGRNISPVWAISVLGDLRTSFAGFMDPGYFSIGAGLTYKPSPNFTAVIHPLTARGVFAKTNSIKAGLGFDELGTDGDLEASFSLGAKLLADYNRELTANMFYKSNLSVFLDYADFGNPEITWINGITWQITPAIGLGAEYAIRYYEPETNGLGISSGVATNNANLMPGEEGYIDPATASAEVLNGLIDGVDLDHFQSRFLVGVTITSALGRIVAK